MPTDAQRRNLASAHHALIAQHEATILWRAAEISKHIDKIALLAQQLSEARKDAARYRWLRETTNFVTSKGQRIDVRNSPGLWDSTIDAAISSTQAQT